MGSRSAFSASLSWENPRSARIRATLRPKARRVRSLFFIGHMMRPRMPVSLWPIGYNVPNWNATEVESENEEDSVAFRHDGAGGFARSASGAAQRAADSGGEGRGALVALLIGL